MHRRKQDTKKTSISEKANLIISIQQVATSHFSKLAYGICAKMPEQCSHNRAFVSRSLSQSSAFGFTLVTGMKNLPCPRSGARGLVAKNSELMAPSSGVMLAVYFMTVRIVFPTMVGSWLWRFDLTMPGWQE